MRLQRMLGHLTTLVPSAPGPCVVIGCGAGVTAGAVSRSTRTSSSVTIAEIEPLVPRVVSSYLGEHNFNVVDNPKVRVQIDDARHYLLTSREKFDAITSDPLDPWVKGAATLYTKEFFEVGEGSPESGGVVTLFVQLYESKPAAVKSRSRRFSMRFPEQGVISGQHQQRQGYVRVFGGPGGSRPRSTLRRSTRSSRARRRAARLLRDIGFYSATDSVVTYAGQATDLKEWLKDASINRDRNPGGCSTAASAEFTRGADSQPDAGVSPLPPI